MDRLRCDVGIVRGRMVAPAFAREYLHLCSQAQIVVLAYHDDAQGTMVEDAGGGGRFSGAVLRPVATLAAGSDVARAAVLHDEAHHRCFIANSVNFPVTIEPKVLLAD